MMIMIIRGKKQPARHCIREREESERESGAAGLHYRACNVAPLSPAVA